MKKAIYQATLILTILSLLAASLAGCTCPLPSGTSTPTSAGGGGGGTLNLYGIDPHTLDPAVSGEVTSHEYIIQLFSGLLRLDDNLTPAPDIAERWQISPDGKTYTFFLRNDARFHDGRPVTAADFKYSWERACYPETGSQTAATYLGDIVGAKEVLTGQTRELSGVRVLDDFTLEVSIDAPKNYFLPKLTYPTAFVVDEANVAKGAKWWHQPNGTGPFRLGQWEENQQFTLLKNELYYGEKARVDQVVFHLYAGMPMDLYETGEIDVVGVSSIYIDKIRDPAGPFYQELSVFPELSFFYIGFNAGRPPFDDPDIRRAFSLAIDRDKLVSLVFRDMVQRADGILPPGLPGYNEALTGPEFDVARAQELIASSKYGDASRLPEITITTAGYGGTISSELEGIVYDWRQNLGVNVKVRQLEPERFLYHLKEEKDEMFLAGWGADYPHPQDFLEVLFHSEADINYGGYSNPEVDRLLERAGIAADDTASLPLYQQAEQVLIDDAACLPLWFGKNYLLTKPYVNNYQLNPLGFATLNRVSLAPH